MIEISLKMTRRKTLDYFQAIENEIQREVDRIDNLAITWNVTVKLSINGTSHRQGGREVGGQFNTQ